MMQKGSNSNRYQFGFNGQLKDNEIYGDGNAYDYGDREYDSRSIRWWKRDRLAQKYPSLSSYVFVSNNYLNAIDYDGQLIIFINGKIGGGSPPAGVQYWNGSNSGFVEEAKSFFNDDRIFFTDKDYGYFSSASNRYQNGYEYVKANFQLFNNNKQEGETVKIVTHSMGAALGEGIAAYLIEQGIEVEYMVHINPYQAADINTVNPNSNETITIDYQNSDDWVINKIPIVSSPGDIKGADYKIREPSGDESKLSRHRSPIDTQGAGFWKQLKSKMQKVEPLDNIKDIPTKEPITPIKS